MALAAPPPSSADFESPKPKFETPEEALAFFMEHKVAGIKAAGADYDEYFRHFTLVAENWPDIVRALCPSGYPDKHILSIEADGRGLGRHINDMHDHSGTAAGSELRAKYPMFDSPGRAFTDTTRFFQRETMDLSDKREFESGAEAHKFFLDHIEAGKIAHAEGNQQEADRYFERVLERWDAFIERIYDIVNRKHIDMVYGCLSVSYQEMRDCASDELKGRYPLILKARYFADVIPEKPRFESPEEATKFFHDNVDAGIQAHLVYDRAEADRYFNLVLRWWVDIVKACCPSGYPHNTFRSNAGFRIRFLDIADRASPALKAEYPQIFGRDVYYDRSSQFFRKEDMDRSEPAERTFKNSAEAQKFFLDNIEAGKLAYSEGNTEEADYYFERVLRCWDELTTTLLEETNKFGIPEMLTSDVLRRFDEMREQASLALREKYSYILVADEPYMDVFQKRNPDKKEPGPITAEEIEGVRAETGKRLDELQGAWSSFWQTRGEGPEARVAFAKAWEASRQHLQGETAPAQPAPEVIAEKLVEEIQEVLEEPQKSEEDESIEALEAEVQEDLAALDAQIAKITKQHDLPVAPTQSRGVLQGLGNVMAAARDAIYALVTLGRQKTTELQTSLGEGYESFKARLDAAGIAAGRNVAETYRNCLVRLREIMQDMHDQIADMPEEERKKYLAAMHTIMKEFALGLAVGQVPGGSEMRYLVELMYHTVDYMNKKGDIKELCGDDTELNKLCVDIINEFAAGVKEEHGEEAAVDIEKATRILVPAILRALLVTYYLDKKTLASSDDDAKKGVYVTEILKGKLKDEKYKRSFVEKLVAAYAKDPAKLDALFLKLLGDDSGHKQYLNAFKVKTGEDADVSQLPEALRDKVAAEKKVKLGAAELMVPGEDDIVEGNEKTLRMIEELFRHKQDVGREKSLNYLSGKVLTPFEKTLLKFYFLWRYGPEAYVAKFQEFISIGGRLLVKHKEEAGSN